MRWPPVRYRAFVGHDTPSSCAEATGARPFAATADDDVERLTRPASPTTTGTPGLMMPAFSAAISRKRRSEILLVVVADRGDRRDHG